MHAGLSSGLTSFLFRRRSCAPSSSTLRRPERLNRQTSSSPRPPSTSPIPFVTLSHDTRQFWTTLLTTSCASSQPVIHSFTPSLTLLPSRPRPPVPPSVILSPSSLVITPCPRVLSDLVVLYESSSPSSCAVAMELGSFLLLHPFRLARGTIMLNTLARGSGTGSDLQRARATLAPLVDRALRPPPAPQQRPPCSPAMLSLSPARLLESVSSSRTGRTGAARALEPRASCCSRPALRRSARPSRRSCAKPDVGSTPRSSHSTAALARQ